MDGFSLDDDFLEAAAELLDIGTSSSLPSVASSPSSPYGEAMDSGPAKPLVVVAEPPPSAQPVPSTSVTAESAAPVPAVASDPFFVFLDGLQLGEYYNMFTKQDMFSVADLIEYKVDDEVLKEVGITSIGHRRKLLVNLQKLSGSVPVAPAVVTAAPAVQAPKTAAPTSKTAAQIAAAINPGGRSSAKPTIFETPASSPPRIPSPQKPAVAKPTATPSVPPAQVPAQKPAVAKPTATPSVPPAQAPAQKPVTSSHGVLKRVAPVGSLSSPDVPADVDESTGIRIKDRKMRKADINGLHVFNPYLPLSSVEAYVSKFSDADRNTMRYSSICVIVKKFDTTTTADKKTQMANWIVSDMKGCEVKLLFFGDAAVKVINFPVTALIHFRNATLMKPKADATGSHQGKKEICLRVSQADTVDEIGYVKDIGLCEFSGQVKCKNYVLKDGSTRHCVYHIAAELKKIQHSRSEFRNPLQAPRPEQKENTGPKIKVFTKDYAMMSPAEKLRFDKREQEKIALNIKECKELERAGVIRSMTAPEVKVQLDSKIARQVGWNPNDTTGKWKNQDTSKIFAGAAEFVTPRLGRGQDDTDDMEIDLSHVHEDNRRHAINGKDSSATKLLKAITPVMPLPDKGPDIARLQKRIQEAEQHKAEEQRRFDEELSGGRRVEQQDTAQQIQILKSRTKSAPKDGPAMPGPVKRPVDPLAEAANKKARTDAADKPKTSFLGPALNDKERERLLGSVPSPVVNMLRQKEQDDRDKIRARQESLEQQASQITSIEVNGVYCNVCKLALENLGPYCRQENHSYERRRMTKYFFVCGSCKYKDNTYNQSTASHACDKCGERNWKKASAHNHLISKEVEAVGKVLPKGDEGWY